MMILDSLLVIDSRGNLIEIRTDINAIEILGAALKAKGFNGSARTLWTKYKKEAVEGGLVKIVRPKSPHNGLSLEERKAKLKKTYDLLELRIIPDCDNESDLAPDQTASLGKEAADLFHKILHGSDRYLTIGIGGGQTMHELVAHLPPLRENFTITATNFATRAPVQKTFDSSYLAMQVHWRSPKCKANICSLPPLPDDDAAYAIQMHQELYSKNSEIRKIFAESTSPDVTFVGVGDFNHTSLVIERVYQYLGFDAHSLGAFKPLGDLNLCLFDQAGNDLTPAIAAKRQKEVKGSQLLKATHCHPFLVGLNLQCFQSLVAEGKKVIVVAGGARKAQALHALLNAKTRCINGLVTDENTLNKLLRLSGES